MSDYDSISSSDNYKHTIGNTLNALPASTDTDGTEVSPTWYGYFVPVILVIVLGIITVATFLDSRSIKRPVSGLPPEKDGHALAPVATAQAPASPGTETSAEETSVPVMAAGHAPVPTARAAPETATKTALRYDKVHSRDRTAKPGSLHSPVGRYTPATTTVIARNRGYAYDPFRQSRRLAYEEAALAHREHLRNLHHYRATVLRRIEQDRRKRLQRIREIDQKG